MNRLIYPGGAPELRFRALVASVLWSWLALAIALEYVQFAAPGVRLWVAAMLALNAANVALMIVGDWYLLGRGRVSIGMGYKPMIVLAALIFLPLVAFGRPGAIGAVGLFVELLAIPYVTILRSRAWSLRLSATATS